MNIEKASTNVGTLDEVVEASVVPDQRNEESIDDLQDIKNQ